jgi:hypothetical protein
MMIAAIVQRFRLMGRSNILTSKNPASGSDDPFKKEILALSTT